MDLEYLIENKTCCNVTANIDLLNTLVDPLSFTRILSILSNKSHIWAMLCSDTYETITK